MEERANPGGSTATAEHEEEEARLPGFRFHPTDEELVVFYLRRKVMGKPLRVDIIKEVDVYKFDPWDIPKANVAAGENEWYFFCLRGRKYRNSIRPNRVTASGFWKATGIDRPIHQEGRGHKCVGLKKSLVYYRGTAGRGTKTDWMMHEYRLQPPTNDSNLSPSEQDAEVWTLCRILKRARTFKKQPHITRAADNVSPGSSTSRDSSLKSDATTEYLLPSPCISQHQIEMVSSNKDTNQSQMQWNLIPQTPPALPRHQAIYSYPNVPLDDLRTLPHHKAINSYPNVLWDDLRAFESIDVDAVLDFLYT